MDEAKFNQLLELALDRLYKSDGDLLDKKFNVNERTVTHRLALHLTTIFKEFDVDCEYNRMIMDKFGNFTEGDYWAKTINLSIDENIDGDDTEAKTVFPDIIIHKRKQNVNLAIIEVKMHWKSRKKDFDFKKLYAYKEDLKYLYGVYLELDENNYLLEFIN
jgi:hypothetical protein